MIQEEVPKAAAAAQSSVPKAAGAAVSAEQQAAWANLARAGRETAAFFAKSQAVAATTREAPLELLAVLRYRKLGFITLRSMLYAIVNRSRLIH